MRVRVKADWAFPVSLHGKLGTIISVVNGSIQVRLDYPVAPGKDWNPWWCDSNALEVIPVETNPNKLDRGAQRLPGNRPGGRALSLKMAGLSKQGYSWQCTQRLYRRCIDLLIERKHFT